MTPQPDKGGEAVKTNGVGKRTTAHLNLTVDMSEQVTAEAARKELHCSQRRKPASEAPRIRIQGQPS